MPVSLMLTCTYGIEGLVCQQSLYVTNGLTVTGKHMFRDRHYVRRTRQTASDVRTIRVPTCSVHIIISLQVSVSAFFTAALMP